MADFYQWNPKTLSVSVGAMDDEHQVLIKKMNALHAAHVAKADRAKLSELLGDLAGYTTKHCADEEAYMASVGFPDLESHKRIHQKLLARVGEHVAELEKTGKLTDALFSFLAFWLSSHIQGIDVKYGEHAKKTAVKKAG